MEDFLSVPLCEEMIPGAKFAGDINQMTRGSALRWLKCRNARRLSKLSLTELREK